MSQRERERERERESQRERISESTRESEREGERGVERVAGVERERDPGLGLTSPIGIAFCIELPIPL